MRHPPDVVNALRTIGQCSGSEVKNYKYCSVSCTDRLFRVFRTQYIITSRRILLGVFFSSLKALSPIDCNYMTNSLQRFEKKCSTEETKSPTSRMPLGYADKHKYFFFGGGGGGVNYPFKSFLTSTLVKMCVLSSISRYVNM